ncbi:MAG: hypothetical protein M3367_19670 [Acidobacteriota bacterium]|nr:hypothetical protein [Acidobacteriota bacterium]
MERDAFDNLDIFLDKTYLECEEMFAGADLLIKEEKITDAFEKLKKVIHRNPQFGKAYNHLGWIYEYKYNQFSKAEECYQKAMQYAPDYTSSYLNYIYLLSHLARFDDLEALLERISQNPNLSISKELLFSEYAALYEMRGFPQEALDYYFKAAIITLDS